MNMASLGDDLQLTNNGGRNTSVMHPLIKNYNQLFASQYSYDAEPLIQDLLQRMCFDKAFLVQLGHLCWLLKW